MIMASGGGWSSALSTLTLTKSDRQALQTSLTASLGGRAVRNRAMLKDQEKTATSTISFGFKDIAQRLVPQPDRVESSSWGFIFSLMVIYSVAAIDAAMSANLASGLLARGKDCASVVASNSIFLEPYSTLNRSP